MPRMTIGVALYGGFGHQLGGRHFADGRARLVATAGIDDKVRAALKLPNSPVHNTLDELLTLPGVDLVSLCSTRRHDQVADALRCMRAGKHVYAEKPCAFTEAELEQLLAAAREHRVKFHEMAGTAFEQPYVTMREAILRGDIGQVVQAFAQKSYPYRDTRPQDEETDGGLTMQAGVHGVRMIEHVTGLRTESLDAIETRTGNPRLTEGPSAGLRMASVMMLRLQTGALAAVTANYLNPRGTGVWGYEELRVFGTRGMIEAYDGLRQARITLGENPPVPLDVSKPTRDYFDLFLDELLDGKPFPISLDDELHPTRVVILARAAAQRHGA